MTMPVLVQVLSNLGFQRFDTDDGQVTPCCCFAQAATFEPVGCFTALAIGDCHHNYNYNDGKRQ
jgi:hypothetical protein